MQLLSLYAAVTYQRVQPSAPEKVKTLGSRLLPTKASTGCSFSGCGRHIMVIRASLAHRCFQVRFFESLATKLTFGRKFNLNQKTEIIFLRNLAVILHLGRCNTLAGFTQCLSSSMRTFPVNQGSEFVTQALGKFDSMVFMDSGVTKTTLNGVPNLRWCRFSPLAAELSLSICS